MLEKPKNYDDVEVKDFDFESISLGGHKGYVKDVEEYTSEVSGKKSLKVYIDTAKDDKQPLYFTEQFNNDTKDERKWSNSAIKYVPLDESNENCVAMLKAFITAIENSNDGYTYDWKKEVTQLINKKVGLVFGLEEYESQDGEVKTIPKMIRFRSIDKINDVKIPKVKLLSGEYKDYEEYKNNTTNNLKKDEIIVQINDEDLPF